MRRHVLSILGAVVGFDVTSVAAEGCWGLEGNEKLQSPVVLECSYDEGWERFRRLLDMNAAHGWPLEDEVFEVADTMLAKHLNYFLEFHRSKSNEFFYDCDREQPHGKICLYGMLSALFVHHIYLRHKIEVARVDVNDGDRSVYTDSTNVARLMVINKNNCLDFFDSSGWPLTLYRLMQVLRPPNAEPFEPMPTPTLTELLRGPSQWPPSQPWQSLPSPRAAEKSRVVAYITGTHAALGREPAEMLQRFAGPLLGCELEPVLEIADSTHCQFVGCDVPEDDGSVTPTVLRDTGGDGTHGLRLANVGLKALAEEHFRPRWGGLDIEDFTAMRVHFIAMFRAHTLSGEADIFVCTSPAVLCTLFLPFGKPMLAYLGEPILLSVPEDELDAWWGTFEALATRPGNFFACYNLFLSEMIRYQTGLSLPVIRLHGLYTGVAYTPSKALDVMVVKGPNICLDPGCLLNRFAAAIGVGRIANGSERCSGCSTTSSGVDVAWSRCGADAVESGASNGILFQGLDELRGAAYKTIAAFRAVVFYPYDVALALFYELYSMGMPLLLPRVDLLGFYAFRGLHSNNEYHKVRPGRDPGPGLSPFFGPMQIDHWFRASLHWSSWTDFARFPHLLRFGGAAEVLAIFQPGSTDWADVSGRMRRFNEEQLVISGAQWAQAVAGALQVA